jgi:hypothetical protein
MEGWNVLSKRKEYSRRALIIRSVSFQQLDQNFLELIKTFPRYEWDLLTHEHGVKLAGKYQSVHRVISYSYTESFSIWRREKSLKGKYYDALIIPVANLTGAGFLNVFLFSLTIKAKKRYMCNLVSELHPVSFSTIAVKAMMSLLNNVVSGILTGALLPFLWLLFPRMLNHLEKRSGR